MHGGELRRCRVESFGNLAPLLLTQRSLITVNELGNFQRNLNFTFTATLNEFLYTQLICVCSEIFQLIYF